MKQIAVMDAVVMRQNDARLANLKRVFATEPTATSLVVYQKPVAKSLVRILADAVGATFGLTQAKPPEPEIIYAEPIPRQKKGVRQVVVPKTEEALRRQEAIRQAHATRDDGEIRVNVYNTEFERGTGRVTYWDHLDHNGNFSSGGTRRPPGYW